MPWSRSASAAPGALRMATARSPAAVTKPAPRRSRGPGLPAASMSMTTGDGEQGCGSPDHRPRRLVDRLSSAHRAPGARRRRRPDCPVRESPWRRASRPWRCRYAAAGSSWAGRSSRGGWRARRRRHPARRRTGGRDRRAAISASSSTSVPRAVFTSDRILWKHSDGSSVHHMTGRVTARAVQRQEVAVRQQRLPTFRGRWRLPPSPPAAGGGCGSGWLIPKPRARRAVACPIRPMPTMPSTRPRSSRPSSWAILGPSQRCCRSSICHSQATPGRTQQAEHAPRRRWPRSARPACWWRRCRAGGRRRGPDARSRPRTRR